MIVGIGSYTGIRLEEICRLRKLDVINIKGVWCFNICEHLPRHNRPAEAWNPKTEAGERVVPIHHKLIEAGILEWAKSANYYLFNELTFSGRDKNGVWVLEGNFQPSRTGLASNRLPSSFTVSATMFPPSSEAHPEETQASENSGLMTFLAMNTDISQGTSRKV
ncbi:hypothetical protein [Acetobacter sp. AAB5]|uniref:hypothetical protein n=1 Tax=Acetobacter sp. AAB5 TaxID=3418370 RepID=UPI003CE68A92